MKRLLVFAALSSLMTWPQLLHLASLATPHHDVYFNMWRLAWFAHALVTRGAAIFDANIFYPELRTLTLSDAMFVEGAFAAPLFWLGLNPVLIHNITLLAGMTLSGAAMWALTEYLTGSAAAGVIAGIVFAYAPFRFEHIMHMEMQWAMWSPLALLALHRTLDTGSLRYGVATGACVALQMLSSVYYGIFLATFVAVAALILLPADRRAAVRPVLRALGAGALLAAIVCGLYARPYLSTHRSVGDRPEAEIESFSARPMNYLSATSGNWLYGDTASRGRMERHLFPGTLPIVLAIVAMLARAPGRRQLAYVLLLVAAFEMSLGPRGFIYPVLHQYVPVYRGLRAPARLGIFVLLFLGVTAGYGYHALTAQRSRRVQAAIAAGAVLLLLIEYHVRIDLIPYPSDRPAVYRVLASLPRGVLAEFPIPRADLLPGDDPIYAYTSIFHWYPLVNGYSGFYPASYLNRLDQLAGFPDVRSLVQLRRDGVRYVVVHQSGYRDAAFTDLRMQLQAAGAFVEVGLFADVDGIALLCQFR